MIGSGLTRWRFWPTICASLNKTIFNKLMFMGVNKMSNRRIFSKTINGVKTKYDNEYFKIVKDYDWNEYIVIDKSLPKFDNEGIEYGYFTDCQIDAIDTFEYQSKQKTLKAEFAKSVCDNLNNGSF